MSTISRISTRSTLSKKPYPRLPRGRRATVDVEKLIGELTELRSQELQLKLANGRLEIDLATSRAREKDSSEYQRRLLDEKTQLVKEVGELKLNIESEAIHTKHLETEVDVAARLLDERREELRIRATELAGLRKVIYRPTFKDVAVFLGRWLQNLFHGGGF